MHDRITARMLKVFPNFTPVYFSVSKYLVKVVQCQFMEIMYDFGQFSLSCFSMILF